MALRFAWAPTDRLAMPPPNRRQRQRQTQCAGDSRSLVGGEGPFLRRLTLRLSRERRRFAVASRARNARGLEALVRSASQAPTSSLLLCRPINHAVPAVAPCQ